MKRVSGDAYLSSYLECTSIQEQIQQWDTEMRNVLLQLTLTAGELKVAGSESQAQLSTAALAMQEAKEKLHTFNTLESKKKFRELDQKVDESRLAVEKAKEEFRQAEDAAESTVTLNEEQEKSLRTRRDGAKAAVKNARRQYESTQGEYDTYKKYNYRRELQQLERAFQNAALNYEKTKVAQAGSIEQKENNRIGLKNQYETSKRWLETAQGFTDKLTLVSPSDGLVVYNREQLKRWGLMEFVIGMNVGPAMALVIIPDFSEWIVGCEVGEEFRNRLLEGQRVAVSVLAVPGMKFSGEVKKIGGVGRPRMEGDTSSPRVYDVEIALKDRHVQFMQGMTVKAEIVTDQLNRALAVPMDALEYDQEGRAWITKITPAGRMKTRVETGQSNDQLVVVTKGVEEGDRIALAPLVAVP